MSRTVYVNGEYLAEEDATISIFDRGFLMADGVYEVTSILGGKMIDFAGHMKRLARSMHELDMAPPETDDEIEAIHRELIKANDLVEGLVYLQVTRGAADRSFLFPDGVKSSLVLFTQTMNLTQAPAAEKGIRIISMPDIRWGRRDIKTIQLLAPSLGKMAAKAAGVDDAWLVEDGCVTEGTSNNAYIVKGGKIITRDLSNAILSGITRAAVLRFAREAQNTGTLLFNRMLALRLRRGYCGSAAAAPDRRDDRHSSRGPKALPPVANRVPEECQHPHQTD